MVTVLHTLLLIIVITCGANDPQADADVACGSNKPAELTDKSGTIESDNYPSDYDPDSDCRWHIKPTNATEGFQIYLELEHFETEYAFDYLQVFAGDSTFGELLYFFNEYYYGTVLATGETELYFRFITDSTITYPGFRIIYSLQEISPLQQQSIIACDSSQQPANLNYLTQGIQSLDYPAHYPSDTGCQWYINPTGNTEGIYLTVVDFYTYQDYLYIYEGDDNSGSYLTYWYLSMEPGTTIYTTGNELFLDFYPYGTETGFELVYYPMDPACASGGGVEIVIDDEKNSTGTITSPGYPYIVPEYLTCRWVITTAENQKVIVTSEQMSLEYTPDCTDEYLEIIDGPDANDLSLGKYCGNSTFGDVSSSGNSIQIYLKTHEYGYFHNIGFSLGYYSEAS